MGFLTGFTGGVTITLGATYLALLAHERNRQSQADILRAQTRVVNAHARDISSPPPRSPDFATDADDALYPPSRAEVAARRRTRLVERAKERWNSEIEGAVRWAQTRDWSGAREDAGERLLGVARRVDGEVREVSGGVKAVARETGRRAAGVAGQVREDAKGVVVGAVEKGREVVERANQKVFSAEEKVVKKVVGRYAEGVLAGQGETEVERALQERFEKREDMMKKSVQEVLAERYTPIDKRDNSRLRGV